MTTEGEQFAEDLKKLKEVSKLLFQTFTDYLDSINQLITRLDDLGFFSKSQQALDTPNDGKTYTDRIINNGIKVRTIHHPNNYLGKSQPGKAIPRTGK